MLYILILWVGIGPLSEKDSMTMVNQEFSSYIKCVAAGEAAKKSFDKGTKEVRFICVEK